MFDPKLQIQKARFCHLCGKQLYGQVNFYENGLVICSFCDKKYLHCVCCHVPQIQGIKIEDQIICKECKAKIPECFSCHKPICGNIYKIVAGLTLAYYCLPCSQQPSCGTCNLPIGNQGQSFQGSDGFIYRCKSCWTNRVPTNEALLLYQQIFQIENHEIQLQMTDLPFFHIVQRADLRKSNQIVNQNEHLHGYFQYDRIQKTRDIFIEDYLPRPLFIAVSAHELAHNWQIDNTLDGQLPEIIEGFANWVARCVLIFMGEKSLAAQLTRQNTIYGTGLIYFNRLESEKGKMAVLQRARMP